MMTPFYKKALALFTRTQEAQIQKGLAKYPEPFNPHNWTPAELLNHALEETVDLTHYLVGLKELLDEKDQVINALQGQVDALVLDHKEEINRLKKAYIDQATMFPARKLKHDINFNPHFDQDDQ